VLSVDRDVRERYVADDFTGVHGHERDRQIACTAKRIDYFGLGSIAERHRLERNFRKSKDCIKVLRRLVTNLH
jgi:hypothetical protein